MAPTRVAELLAWARTPLATAEVAALMGTSREEAAAALATRATRLPAGADAHWTSPP